MASPVLHGREASLGALRSAIEDMLAGRGKLAVVSGEAGIGKSTLVAALTREAEARGAAVTWGRAWEFADAPPYFPVWPCLRVLGIDPGAGDGSHDRHAFQLWESVIGALARAAEGKPIVWVLEDLHAADLATLDLLTFLALPLRAIRALVVVTVRSNDPRVDGRMSQRITRMIRDGLDVPLAPLADRDVAAVVEDTTRRPVPASALRRIADLTGGNPLFIVECARAFHAAGGIEGTLGSLPPTVRQVVGDRVGLLPEATRGALARGAVLGREFSAAIVARMMDTLPARAIDALLPALRSGIVTEVSPGLFAFSHALVRDAIEERLEKHELVQLHARASSALATLGDSVDVLVERARHALEALGAEDTDGALVLARRATELLERDGAFDRAFELHSRVARARATGLLPAAPPAETLRYAEIARAAGRSEASRAACERLISLARAANDAELLARAALLHGADVRPGVVDKAQIALLEEALEALGEGAPELGCLVLARLATALTPAPDPRSTIGIAREAIHRARAAQSDALLLEVLDVAMWALWAEPIAARAPLVAERLALAERLGDLPKALRALEWLAFDRLTDGDFEGFCRDVDRSLALADDSGHPRHRWRPLLLASARALALGRFAESERYVTEVAELAVLTDDPALPFALAMHDVMRTRCQTVDVTEAAMSRLVQALGPAFADPNLLAALVRAQCASRKEDVETVRAALASCATEIAIFESDSGRAAVLAEAYALAGTDDDRRRLRALLAGGQREITGGPVSYVYEGPVVRALGLLDAALDDLPRAADELREAYALAVQRKQAPWIAQIAWDLSKVQERMGRADEARRLREEAARIARELGMPGLARLAGGVAPEEPSGAAVAIARAADGWTVTRGSTNARVKDSRGMQLLARLVERPGEEIHVLALSSDEPGTSAPESNAGALLDDKARDAYRRRVADLDEDLEEAERGADLGRVEKLRRERDALVAEIARAAGLGGRARPAASATERARVNVQRRVKDAIGRIAEADEGLGRFFEKSIRTGTYCVFRPD